ncbi:MAG TPA: hypothetical protein VN848_04050 [Gemmatimonadales bacterium]|nr:hypothetical protein [Gemmatimonadales bacterium]
MTPGPIALALGSLAFGGVTPPGLSLRTPPEAVRYGPCAVRYVVHRDLHITQSIGGQPQTQELGARVFVSATIVGPGDTAGYPATFTVDSVVPDSGMPAPLAEGLAKVRALVLAGRVSRRGEFRGTPATDSLLAAVPAPAALLGSFRDFLPRIPSEGAQLGGAWADTLSVTVRTGGGEVTRRTVVSSKATAWEPHGDGWSLRIEAQGTFTVAGSGANNGQPFTVTGKGVTATQARIADDGRFLGGESRDSTDLTVSLPVQNLTMPVTQILHSTVAVLP